MRIGVICCTGRKGSYTLKVCRLVNGLTPESTIFQLATFPFTDDLLQKRLPHSFLNFDAFLFVAPTYFSGVPSRLSNFLESLNLEETKEIFKKPVGIITIGSGTPSNLGAANLRGVFIEIVNFLGVGSETLVLKPIYITEAWLKEHEEDFATKLSELVGTMKKLKTVTPLESG